MNAEQKDTLYLLRRVHAFLVDAKLEGPLAPDAAQVTAVGALAERLAGHDVAADESVRRRRVGVETRRKLIDELRTSHLVPLLTQGRALFAAELSDPVIAAALTMPRTTRDPLALVAAARAVANTLEPHVARFVTVGFAPDFLTRLRTMADRVESAAVVTREEVKVRSATTAVTASDVRVGRRLVGVLDRLVREALRRDPERLAAWKSVRRMPKRKTRTEEPAAGTPVVPLPVPPYVTSEAPAITPTPEVKAA